MFTRVQLCRVVEKNLSYSYSVHVSLTNVPVGGLLKDFFSRSFLKIAESF